MITIRYFAGARAAAGTTEETLPPSTLPALLNTLGERHGPALTRVLGAASFLVDGVAWHRSDDPLPAGCTVDVLPPFAGG